MVEHMRNMCCCHNFCSAALVFECTEGRGRIIGSFGKQIVAAYAYCGELLGLMTIHLIFLVANMVNLLLTGPIRIIFDCLGALEKDATLPLNRIPTRCKHSDILKNIMMNCSSLTFKLASPSVYVH
jgi:hypothetical protein